MSNHQRFAPDLLAAAIASIFVTAAVTTLSLTKTISPEWFFGAPAVGAVVTGISVMRRAPDQLMAQSKNAADIVESFAQTQQLIVAEAEIAHNLAVERGRILESLIEEHDVGIAEYLGRDFLTHHLEEVEGRRMEARSEINRLLRVRALAHAELIGVAQKRGIVQAHLLEPDELISAIVAETSDQESMGSLGQRKGRKPKNSGRNL
jgi:hypothetical protein